MGKAHAGIELRIACQTLFQAGHTDEYQTESLTVIQITQHFQTGHLQAVGFVDENEFTALVILHLRGVLRRTTGSSYQPSQRHLSFRNVSTN